MTPDPFPSERDWRCECGDLNRWHESCCYRCGAGRTEEEDAVPDFPSELVEAVREAVSSCAALAPERTGEGNDA